jgi:predicted ester cyclase
MTGVLVRQSGEWRWAQWHGSEPAPTPAAPNADPAAVVRDVFERLFLTGVDALDGHPGMDALRSAFPMIRTAFPDATIELQQQLVDGDRVASHWIVRGTHLGDFFGAAPTGNAVKYQNIGIATVVDGRIVQYNAENGWLAVLRQIGALPLTK